MITKNLIRGSIWLADLDPTIGREQAKTRPCLIISTNGYNNGFIGLVVVLPLTSKDHDRYWNVPLDQSEGGLEKKSYIICDQPRSISLQRLHPKKCFGLVTDHTMQLVEDRLSLLLYLNQNE